MEMEIIAAMIRMEMGMKWQTDEDGYVLGLALDGVVLLVMLLRSWTEGADGGDTGIEDPSAKVPLDLRNAYGLFCRSHAFRAAVDFNFDVATWAAAEWSQKPIY